MGDGAHDHYRQVEGKQYVIGVDLAAGSDCTPREREAEAALNAVRDERQRWETAANAANRAAKELSRQLEEANERASEVVSDVLDPAVGVAWMRCSPGLPGYVRGLEAERDTLREMVNGVCVCDRLAAAARRGVVSVGEVYRIEGPVDEQVGAEVGGWD